MYPTDLKYTQQHEWVRVVGHLATVGITDYAQAQLGDVVFVELPLVGTRVIQMEPFGVVESVKAASDLFSPVTGTVKRTNETLQGRPELVNQDPYGEGWMMEVEVADISQLDVLMTAEQYESSLPSR